MKKKQRISKQTHRYKLLHKKLMRGALGAGTAYVLLVLLIIAAAGSMLVGNIVPTSMNVDGNQPVIIISTTPESGKNNLQLYTFPGATYTPSPTPTSPPQPQNKFPSGHGSGAGGGSTCFPAGTKIFMADGSQQNIENVQVGDKVMGYDGKKLVAETVLETESPIRDHLYSLSFADGSILRLTREHPLYTTNGWSSISPQDTLKENPNLHVKSLHIGDAVLQSSGKYIKITKMDYNPGDVQTYNLKKVTGYNDFFANSFLAHNKGGSSGGAAVVGAR